MISWRRNATNDMVRIFDLNVVKYNDVDTAVHIYAAIRAVVQTLDQPMNGSRGGRLGNGEREKFVRIGNNKYEYFVVFDEPSPGNVEVVNIKHRLEQYP